MKKLGIFSLVITLVMSFTIPTGVFAAEPLETDIIAEAGMAPDSPLYFLERWGEQISLTFTFKAENKVQKALQYAEERLAEAEAMAVQNNVRAMEKAANVYQNCLEVATRNMEKAMTKGIDTSEQVTDMMSKHIAYSYQYQYAHRQGDTECDDCQQIRQQIRQKAQICQEDTVEALCSQDPEAAVRLNLRLMEQECNRIQNMTEQGNGEQANEALQQWERLRNMNQEMLSNPEQTGLSNETCEMAQQSEAYQNGIVSQVRNCFQNNNDSNVSQAQNGNGEQQNETVDGEGNQNGSPGYGKQ